MSSSTDKDRERVWFDLIHRFDKRLRGYLRRAHVDLGEVEETLWDVWQMAVEEENALSGASDPWPVLRDLARRSCKERMNVQRHERAAALNALDALPSERAQVSVQASADAMEAWLTRVLGGLTMQQRLAVDYRYRRGWSYRLIGPAIGVSEATARVHAMRGLANLRLIARRSPPPDGDDERTFENLQRASANHEAEPRP